MINIKYRWNNIWRLNVQRKKNRRGKISYNHSELKKYNIIMSIKMDHLNVGLLKNMKITPNVIIDNNVFNKLI